MNHQWMYRVGLLFIASSTVLLADDKIRIGTTADYSEGYYGATTRTTMTTTGVFARYLSDNKSIRIDLPYLIIAGPSNTTVASDSTTLVSTATTSTYRETEGVGDIVLSGMYEAFSHPQLGLAVDVGVKLKLPTASHRAGLGTGELDESVQLYAYQNVNDLTLMLETGYKWVGNPQSIHYRNTLNASAGVIYQVSTLASLGGIFDAKQSVYANLGDQMEITLYGTYKLSPSWYTQLHTYKGLTHMSPSFGLGATLGYQF